jgi:hypothetical protein
MKKDKNSLKLAILWTFSFVVIIFMMTMRANAESSNKLPYRVYDEFSTFKYNDFLTAYKNNTSFANTYPSITYAFENNISFGHYQETTILGDTYYVYIIPNDEYSVNLNGIPYKDFDTTTNYLSVIFTGYRISFRYRNGTLTCTGGTTSPAEYSIGFCGSFLTLPELQYLNGNIYWGETYPVLVDQNFVFPVQVGTAIVPPEPFIPQYLTGDTAPTNVPPSYVFTEYNWTTKPTFDGSSVLNAIQSTKDTLDWLGDNLRYELANFGNNIKGCFEYIGKTIQYYGNGIVKSISDGIQNFYDNMKNLVEPIHQNLANLYNDFRDFADLFIHPFDEEEYEEQIANCALITEYNTLLDNSEVIKQILIDAEEKDSFILYIDFENPFADSEHKIIKSEINFNWLVPLRPSYRPFLWVFTMLECFIGGFRLLGNIIGGKAK